MGCRGGDGASRLAPDGCSVLCPEHKGGVCGWERGRIRPILSSPLAQGKRGVAASSEGSHRGLGVLPVPGLP